ncbi:MAG: hypothetical protein HYZ63_02360 [Candidatus Andersenbacteria bacterium]|nr:hypothetical protein [Candidatus Andersenbacteria bacterium]
MAEDMMMIVTSKVRAYLKDKGGKMSGDLPTALNKEVMALLNKAVGRSKGNKRTTVKPQDV